ncbi:MAG: endonuclease/exonuclease/phosphatase family protein [Planctomycetales bacterium]|nr:endonuclease/exonuclease/phosphatase family protein [Planctomycetales bacterium]
MRRLNSFLFLLLLVGGGFVFMQNFEIEGLKQLRVRSKEPSSTGNGLFGTTVSQTGAPPRAPGETIRIATFNVQVLGTAKIQKPIVMERLANICRRFDVVAIQEIASADQDILPLLIEKINNSFGVAFDYIVGPRVGRNGQLEQYGFVFNTATIEANRGWIYSMNDPDDLLAREPLVASFRARAAKPENAFTFSLVTIRTDSESLERELSVLDDALQVVRNDGFGEDDIILLGDFGVNDRQLGDLARTPGMSWAIAGVPTDTRGTMQLDNILFSQQSTKEFAGRSGVFDFMREFNMTQMEALEISDHLPVWAEFSIYEGGVPGRVANLPQQP